MDGNKFKGVMERAQKLMMSEEFNRKVESRSKSVKDPSENFSEMEASIFGYGEPNETENVIDEGTEIQAEPCSRNGDHLPKAILESFKKVPPMQSGYVDELGMLMNGLSAKDKKTIAEARKKVVDETEEKKPILETSSNGVDYSLIKTIVDESVRNAMKSMNESASPTFKGMRFVNGNTFQFLDNKGNLYEGTLKLKRKAK